jgi:hypothetical protein
MIYLHKKFRMPSTNGSVKLKDRENVRTVAMLLFYILQNKKKILN